MYHNSIISARTCDTRCVRQGCCDRERRSDAERRRSCPAIVRSVGAQIADYARAGFCNRPCRRKPREKRAARNTGDDRYRQSADFIPAWLYDKVFAAVDAVALQTTWKRTPEKIDFIQETEELRGLDKGNLYCRGAVVLRPPADAYPVDTYWMYPHRDDVIQRNKDCVNKIADFRSSFGNRLAGAPLGPEANCLPTPSVTSRAACSGTPKPATSLTAPSSRR